MRFAPSGYTARGGVATVAAAGTLAAIGRALDAERAAAEAERAAVEIEPEEGDNMLPAAFAA